MEIINIQTIKNGQSFGQYIESIQLYQTSMIDGVPLTQPLTKLHEDKMNELISAILNENNDNNNIPNYIIALFQFILDNVKGVSIDVGRINNEFLFKRSNGMKLYGSLLFKSIYFDSSNNIQWDPVIFAFSQ